MTDALPRTVGVKLIVGHLPVYVRHNEWDAMIEAAASAMAIYDNYNPNDYEPARWASKRDEYLERAEAALKGALKGS